MTYERIMGIEVIDEEGYQQYREHMIPILHSFGGSFGYDFKVNEVLKSKTNEPINRVFTIDFPSKEVMETFFTALEYREVKAQYFQNAVKSVTTISMHEKHA